MSDTNKNEHYTSKQADYSDSDYMNQSQDFPDPTKTWEYYLKQKYKLA